ncbi:hypothetical protein GF312_05195, partial [Candidatus Poribacteria bacterium]|nr:hypothetical protein [Candidatus Poribacteria bacterium]
MPKEQNEKEKSRELAPTVSDFSTVAIRKARRRHTVEHWATRYSAVPFALSVLGSFLFGFSEMAFIAMTGTFGLACFPWIYIYYMKADSFEHKYVEKLQKQIQRETERKRENLKHDLASLGCPDGAMQMDKLQAKFNSLDELLLDRLDPQEITFKRYRGIALEVFLSGVDNLSAIVSALKSISEIDEVYIGQKLKQLRSSADTD